jgi:P4 family phage/plasmid primase-like protien
LTREYNTNHERGRSSRHEESFAARNHRELGLRPSELNRRAVFNPEDSRGLTAAIAEAITATDHFAKDVGGKLYHYEGGVYRPGGEEHIAVRAKGLLSNNSASAKWSTHRVREVTEYIRVDAPSLWEQPPRDRINLRNGILNIESRVLVQHTPAFLSPVQLPLEYDPEAECPAWDEFVAATFPEDTRELAYEIPALIMVPETSIQKAVLITGDGANGKSTYLAAVEAFVGGANCAALSLQKIESDRFAASRLVGKLANICPDLPSDHLTSTSTFKAITGGDRITAEYKFRDSFDLLPFARLVFSANHPPRSGDASHAFYRRWLVVPFDRTFEREEQIPRSILDARLSDPKELSGVLNRALEALQRIREHSGFTVSKSTEDALAEFQQTTDPLTVWLERNTVEHPDAMVAQDELRRAYNAFCENSGKPGMTPQAFGRALARVKSGIEKGQRTWRGVPNTRVYLGIGFGEGGPDEDSDGGHDQRAQRDQRNDGNCFVEGVATELKKNRDKRVDRVEDFDILAQRLATSQEAKEGKGSNTSSNSSLSSRGSAGSEAEGEHVVVESEVRLTAKEVEQVKRLAAQGHMSYAEARRAVLAKREPRRRGFSDLSPEKGT